MIDARDKYWGPNFLLFGLGLSSSSTDAGGFRMHVGYRRPWLTSSGLEGRIDATVGSDLTNIHAELRQPLSNAAGLLHRALSGISASLREHLQRRWRHQGDPILAADRTRRPRLRPAAGHAGRLPCRCRLCACIRFAAIQLAGQFLRSQPRRPRSNCSRTSPGGKSVHEHAL